MTCYFSIDMEEADEILKQQKHHIQTKGVLDLSDVVQNNVTRAKFNVQEVKRRLRVI